MTKTEARAWIRRVREDLRDMETALLDNDPEAMLAATRDAMGSLGEIEADLSGAYGDPRGVGGLLAAEGRGRIARMEP